MVKIYGPDVSSAIVMIMMRVEVMFTAISHCFVVRGPGHWSSLWSSVMNIFHFFDLIMDIVMV